MWTRATDEPAIGPAMRELNERQQAFVKLYLSQVRPDPAAAYATAGYEPGSQRAAATAASRLLGDPKIVNAIREWALVAIQTDGVVIATRYLIEAAGDPSNSAKERRLSSEAILNRAGIHEVKETRITGEFTLTDKAKVRQIETWAAQLKIDPQKLLDHVKDTAHAAIDVVIDAEYTEVNPDDEITA